MKSSRYIRNNFENNNKFKNLLKCLRKLYTFFRHDFITLYMAMKTRNKMNA